jgi:hypothetical protein
MANPAQGANRPSGGSVAGKVMPTSTRTPTPNTGRPGELPQHTAPNPSQTNGNNPPKIPPSHRQSGMDGPESK